MKNWCRIRDAALRTRTLFFATIHLHELRCNKVQRRRLLLFEANRDGSCSNLNVSAFQSFERSAAITMKLTDYGKAQVHSVITSGRSSGLLRRRAANLDRDSNKVDPQKGSWIFRSSRSRNHLSHEPLS